MKENNEGKGWVGNVSKFYVNKRFWKSDNFYQNDKQKFAMKEYSLILLKTKNILKLLLSCKN